MQKVNYRSDKKTDRVRYERGTPVFHDFGVKDSKGRAMGTQITPFLAEHKELSAAELDAIKAGLTRSYYTIEPGIHYGVWVHTTRNGKTFGASFNQTLLKTEADRAEYIEQYLKDAKKRARKTAEVT